MLGCIDPKRSEIGGRARLRPKQEPPRSRRAWERGVGDSKRQGQSGDSSSPAPEDGRAEIEA